MSRITMIAFGVILTLTACRPEPPPGQYATRAVPSTMNKFLYPELFDKFAVALLGVALVATCVKVGSRGQSHRWRVSFR